MWGVLEVRKGMSTIDIRANTHWLRFEPIGDVWCFDKWRMDRSLLFEKREKEILSCGRQLLVESKPVWVLSEKKKDSFEEIVLWGSTIFRISGWQWNSFQQEVQDGLCKSRRQLKFTSITHPQINGQTKVRNKMILKGLKNGLLTFACHGLTSCWDSCGRTWVCLK